MVDQNVLGDLLKHGFRLHERELFSFLRSGRNRRGMTADFPWVDLLDQNLFSPNVFCQVLWGVLIDVIEAVNQVFVLLFVKTLAGVLSGGPPELSRHPTNGRHEGVFVS